jgi:hypothetical protein
MKAPVIWDQTAATLATEHGLVGIIFVAVFLNNMALPISSFLTLEGAQIKTRLSSLKRVFIKLDR